MVRVDAGCPDSTGIQNLTGHLKAPRGWVLGVTRMAAGAYHLPSHENVFPQKTQRTFCQSECGIQLLNSTLCMLVCIVLCDIVDKWISLACPVEQSGYLTQVHMCSRHSHVPCYSTSKKLDSIRIIFTEGEYGLEAPVQRMHKLICWTFRKTVKKGKQAMQRHDRLLSTTKPIKPYVHVRTSNSYNKPCESV